MRTTQRPETPGLWELSRFKSWGIHASEGETMKRWEARSRRLQGRGLRASSVPHVSRNGPLALVPRAGSSLPGGAAFSVHVPLACLRSGQVRWAAGMAQRKTSPKPLPKAKCKN